MTFIADFHVHSRFSRATSKNLDLEHLYIAAQCKGVTLVGTGDATHPGWMAEIKEKLIPSTDGLFRLNNDLANGCSKDVPANCRSKVHFMLVSEISNIYKKDGKTRKNHNLVFLPTIESAERFNRRLDKIGNIQSDGRPILGLDARDLLEILMETDDRAFLIPAHIWTPWFSMLGSKSGFDSLEECFQDLSKYIFAVETGLSSDPAMNRLVSSLDRLTLVSNSDAHSPSKLAREANLFYGRPGFDSIRAALENRSSGQFGGTIEFYPEEGKYHLDGHRKCGVRLTPSETRELGGICPVCARPLTVGVFNRVQALADRTPESIPDGLPSFESLIPLQEILSEVLQVGPNTKTVGRAYTLSLETIGNELHILRDAPMDHIDMIGIPLLGEAITRMRNGRVNIAAGYDGEFGRIRIFSDREKSELLGQRRLFPTMKARQPTDKTPPANPHRDIADLMDTAQPDPSQDHKRDQQLAIPSDDQSNREQQQAITHDSGPLLIVAGPGTGKTRTLTHRMAYLIQEQNVLPETMLAVTFTEKAAEEMRSRLTQLLDEDTPLPFTATLHALCWQLIQGAAEKNIHRIIDDEDRLFILKRVLDRMKAGGQTVTLKPKDLLKRVVEAKQQLQGPEAFFEAVAPEAPTSQFVRAYGAYQDVMEKQYLLDFEDLIFGVVRRLEADDDFRQSCRRRFSHVFVDEYQDVNYGQYRLIRALVPATGNLCVIGDPDQAIYGFRGSDVAYFNRFVEDFPAARVINLTRNYRSAETILEASWQVIRPNEMNLSGMGIMGSRLYSHLRGAPHLAVLELPSEKAQAVAVGQTIEKAVGGAGFIAIDAGKVDSSEPHDYSFADFAVLYRTSVQADTLMDVFLQAGIPFQAASRQKYYNNPLVAALLSLLRIMNSDGSFNDLNHIAGILKPSMDKKMVMALLDDMDARGLPLHQALDQADPIRFQKMTVAKQRRLAESLDDLKYLISELTPLPLAERISHLASICGARAGGIDSGDIDEDALERLTAHAHRCAGDMERFLATLTLHRDADMVQAKVEKVTLSTLHAAKGLEFPVVFIVGCEDGLIPLHRDGQHPSDVDEERRLFYVGLTRARAQLYLTWSRKRRIHGRQETRILSPFVSDIEQRLLKHQAPQVSTLRKVQQVQLKLF